MIAYKGKLFFGATRTGGDRELWKTSGLAATTKLVKDIKPGGSSGTKQVRDISPGAADSNRQNSNAWDKRLVFRATDDAKGAKPWIRKP
jgi:ELWxxDGT repeat protein